MAQLNSVMLGRPDPLRPACREGVATPDYLATGVTVIWYPLRFGTPLYQIWYPRARWEVPHRRARLTVTVIWYPRHFGTPPPLLELSQQLS